MHRPKVSVIMGIFNCASTLEEALDSLFAQTYQNFNVVLCEDGSSDDTYEVAKRYAEHHDNIILIQNPHNLGLNATLNRCLKLAAGEYIARMDGDDISDPTRFEKEVAFLDSHPEYAFVSCPMLYFDQNGVFGRGKARESPTKCDFVYGAPFCHAPCMVRRQAYELVNGYTESKWLMRYEDYDLWTKMYANGLRGYNLQECLYSMRDDRVAIKRRKFRGRINGIYAHYLSYRLLRYPIVGFLKFAIVSLVKGLMPKFIYTYYHRKKLSNDEQ